MNKITLREMLEQEKQLSETIVAELKQAGKKEVHIEDLWEVVTGCVKLGIPIKLLPLSKYTVSVSL